MTMTPKQPNEYTCGPTALHYFLYLHGKSPNTLEELIAAINPTPEYGTDPEAIGYYLKKQHLEYEVRQFPKSLPLHRDRIPYLVNYNYENEGDHYGVIKRIDSYENITLWNPYTAELNYFSRENFMQVWYSPLKKLKNWCLRLT